MQETTKVRPGFSLIELLIAVTMAAILTTALVSLIGMNSLASGRDSRRRADLEKVASALEIYRNDNSRYPACASGNPCDAASIGGTFPTWMPVAPADPSTGRVYRYSPSPAGCNNVVPAGTRCTGYVLCTALERTTAADAACSGAGSCGSGVNCSGSVRNP